MSEKSRHKNHEKGNHATCWLGRVPVATASLGGLRSGSQRWAIRHWRHTLATTAATRPKMRYVSRIATISPAKAEGRVAASAVAKRRHCMFGLAAQEQRTDNVFWALPLCPTPHGWTTDDGLPAMGHTPALSHIRATRWSLRRCWADFFVPWSQLEQHYAGHAGGEGPTITPAPKNSVRVALAFSAGHRKLCVVWGATADTVCRRFLEPNLRNIGNPTQPSKNLECLVAFQKKRAPRNEKNLNNMRLGGVGTILEVLPPLKSIKSNDIGGGILTNKCLTIKSSTNSPPLRLRPPTQVL